MHGPTPENQGVTDIDPSPAPNNQGVMDADEESDQEDLTKSHAFREAEDRGCAAAEDDTHQWSRRTHKPQQDPVYEYIDHLFDGMDPEAGFTFLTREDSVTMLTFLTAQMSAKQGLKQFEKAGADTIMSELEQLIYCKVMEGCKSTQLTRE